MPSRVFANCRWVPWAIAGGFVVVIAVNAALAWFAVASDTGLVTAHPFTTGTGYNRILDEAAAQAALGWHGDVEWVAAAPERGLVSIELRDRTGQPLSGIHLEARIIRPIEKLPETDLALTETAPGRYAAMVALARPGQWEVRVVARRGAAIYQFQDRIVVQ